MASLSPLTLTTQRDDHRIAWLAALAIAIHVLESAFPSPLPGVKPGLANVVTIAVVVLYGWRSACWVVLLRVLVSSLLLGTFLSPTFILSLSGALASLAILAPTRLLPQAFGPLGLSLLAAMAHIGGQFLVARLLFIPHDGLFHLLPPLMTFAVIFGIVNGMIVAVMTRQLSPTAP